MTFRTPLSVRHEIGEEWSLLDPLVFEGSDEFFVIRRGFTTDFASIPRPVRWLFDTAGTNSEPGVLHDALWRESKRVDAPPRVDPWDADGLFRRALRQSGATAMTRALMWIAVRAAAIAGGRFGKQGPALPVKVGQVAGMGVAGVVSVGAPTAVALMGRAFYWVVEWLVAVPWSRFERAHGYETNLPWWPGRKQRAERKGKDEKNEKDKALKESPEELLLIIPIKSHAGAMLASWLSPRNDVVVADEQLDQLPPEVFRAAY